MTNAELAILTLLAEHPRHGYEIEQVIEERGMREWSELGFSSIYYLLKRLQHAGLVAAQLEQGTQGPTRKVYRLTPPGVEALRIGVAQALSTPQHAYPPLQLGLANWPLLPRGQALQALRQYRDTLAVRRAQLQTSWQRQRPLPSFVDAMFSYSIAMLSAEREWVSSFIRQMEAEQDGLQEGTQAPVSS